MSEHTLVGAGTMMMRTSTTAPMRYSSSPNLASSRCPFSKFTCSRAPSGARSGCGRSFARLSKATRRDQEAACVRKDACDDARSRRDVFLSLTAGFVGIGACSGEDGPLRSIAIAAAEEELLPVKSLPKGAKQTQTQEVLDLIKDGVKMHVTEDYTKCLQVSLLLSSLAVF